MPTPNNRKIISLAALTEFKTKYDEYVAGIVAGLVPYSNASGPVNLGENAIYASEFSDSSSNTGGGRIYFYEGDLNISSVVNVAVTTGNGSIFTYNGVEVATKSDISAVLRFKGNATVSELGTLASGSTLSSGDTYNITDAGYLDKVGSASATHYKVNPGDNVAWVKPASGQGYWDILAGTLDTSNFVTNSQLNTALAGYLPLSAGSGKALTGSLYLNSNSINFGSSGDSSIQEASGHLTFQSHDDTFRYIGSDEDAVVSVDNLTATRTFRYPDESGTLVTGEYATTGVNGDIAALFN